MVGMVALVVLIIYLGMRFAFPECYAALKNGDPEALHDFLSQGKTWKTLIVLFILQFVQIISIVLPSPPIHIAGGMVAGTLRAFATCHVSYCLANLTVFVLARKFSKSLNRLGSANMKKSVFTWSVFAGGFVPTLLLCSIGSNIMQADYPFILLLVSIDIICMWEVYESREKVESIMRRIADLHNARKAVKSEQRAAKKEAKLAEKQKTETTARQLPVAAEGTEVPQEQ